MPGRPRVAVLALALAADALGGEPPARVHPVVAMGKLLNLAEARAPTAAGRFGHGLLVAGALPLGWWVVGTIIERVAPWPLQALALKPTFAGRALLTAAATVEIALRRGEIDQARAALRALVSRPTASLDVTLASAAIVESVAENLVDSWLTPLLGYAAFGLGGAYALRAINTADAMWGYRGARYEYLGKAAARLDDAANWLPARVGVVLLALVSGTRWRAALGGWKRDAGRTASPNAGQVMAAAAGALDVRLEKAGHYLLNARARDATPADARTARWLVARCLIVGAALALLVVDWRGRG